MFTNGMKLPHCVCWYEFKVLISNLSWYLGSNKFCLINMSIS